MVVEIMSTKKFPLRSLLTVTTGRLLTTPEGPRDNGIGQLYEILDWMTDDSNFTHQLPRAADECRQWLFKWFPELGTASACLDKLDQWISADKTGTAQEGVKMWITELKMIDPRIKDEYEVGKIHVGDHKAVDPIKELVEMRESKEGIVVVNIGKP